MPAGMATATPSTPSATAATAQSHGEANAAGDAERKRGAEDPEAAFVLGERVFDAAMAKRYDRIPGDPIYRPLKIYTIDPSSRRLEGQTALINIPYERLQPGPVSARFAVEARSDGPLGSYPPIDLDEPRLLIVNGHDPAPTDPVFHHQMVYAVAMSTCSAFRTALGRELSWGFNGRRLRLVPHAFEEANARYVREREALEFGWYRVPPEQAGELPPNGLVFACLSHDIIAHELTHALLDGLRVRFDRATNPDVPAFHEAFADLVALLQRFSYQEVVRANIIRTGGDLSKDSDLLRFAFEIARGQGIAALRAVDLEAEHKYDPKLPDHDLGTILVSAIIEAFLTIYHRKSEPIIRMANDGRGAIGEGGYMSAELIDALAHVVSRLASQFLGMCIRAIDYCPPVDIDFGEYLRALITADRDLVPDDPYAYREALIHAFRRRRIYPAGVPSLTEDALLWRPPLIDVRERRLGFGSLRFSGDPGRPANVRELRRQASLVGELVCRPENMTEFGLAAAGDPALEGDEVDRPVVESVRTSRRVGPDGQLTFDLVVEISQRRAVPGGGGYPAFDFYGGSTIILGSRGEVRLVISKSVKNKERLLSEREYAASAGAEIYALASCRHQKAGPS